MTPLRNTLRDTTEMEMEIETTTTPPNPGNLSKPWANETPEEKILRRKSERRKRILQKTIKKMAASGSLSTPSLRGPLQNQFNKIFDKEAAFVTSVQQVLPEVRHPHLQDEEDEKMADVLVQDEDEGFKKTEEKRKKFQAKMKLLQATNNKGSKKLGAVGVGAERALTHEELKERLHAKIEALSQKKNDKKRLRKLKKKEMKKLEEDGAGTGDKKKKFISKANPNLKNQSKGENVGGGGAAGGVIKEEIPSTGETPKTPLRKKPVVKSNGEIVYSKFDFISQDDPTVKKVRPKAEDLLKRVQKGESKVKHLEAKGRTVEAAGIVESQKWDSALKRAQGEKIRDDVTLLKKTIKKQEKRKQVSKKKWQERTEHVDKLKEAKQDKRQANIQARKDDRVKKTKKQQRKKGRLA